MKKHLVIAASIAAAIAVTALGQSVDKRPLIYPHHLNQKDFADLGLWFWVNDSHHPPGKAHRLRCALVLNESVLKAKDRRSLFFGLLIRGEISSIRIWSAG
jgi:hypothetical protein